MNFNLTDEQILLQQTVHRFAEEEVAPGAIEREETSDLSLRAQRGNPEHSWANENAPDYAINSGGLINVANELEDYDRERAFKQAEGIYDTLMEIFKVSAEEGIPTNVASDLLAENRIRSVAKFKTFYTSTPRRVFRRG